MEPSQITEWVENPVTIELAQHIASELQEIRGSKGLGAFHPFQPERTQEILATLNGCEEILEMVLAYLEGDWTFLEDEEDGDAVLE